MAKPSLVERSRIVVTTMGSQAMVSREVTADNGATKEHALEETNVLGGNPIPKIKRGPALEALAKEMARVRARARGKGARGDR